MSRLWVGHNTDFFESHRTLSALLMGQNLDLFPSLEGWLLRGNPTTPVVITMASIFKVSAMGLQSFSLCKSTDALELNAIE